MAALDVIRGFALFGVLVANVHHVVSGRCYMTASLDVTTADAVVTKLVDVAISGKSITMLSMLFGLGFALQLIRGDERGAGPEATQLYVRRLAILFAIGACHCIFVWWGDVTWNYALAGLGLLAFRRVSARALLAWGFALAFVPRLIYAVPEVGGAIRAWMSSPDMPRFRADTLAAMLGHDFPARMAAHVRNAIQQVLPIPWYFPWLIGRFLLGFWAGRRRLFDRDGALALPLFRRLFVVGLALAIAGHGFGLIQASSLMSGLELLGPAKVAVSALHEASWLGLAIAYASGIVLLMQRPASRRVLLVLAPVGRMALTTYLCQSIVTTFVFYGWGLGYAGKLGAAPCFAICVAIFAVQVVIAHLWLRWFRFGPAEWVWRSLVYRRAQPLRRQPESPSPAPPAPPAPPVPPVTG